MASEVERTEKKLKLTEGDMNAINHLREALEDGEPWYIALLEAINLWESTEEVYKGRLLKYLVEGEAFDWLTLAERLLNEVKDLVPEEEVIKLLFYDIPPLELPKDEFQKLIGTAKYKAYLNYTYGVLAEEALISAVTDEVRKDKRSLGDSKDNGSSDRAFKRIYGLSEEELLQQFLREKGYERRLNLSLGDMKEFTYWLFKYRVKHSDPSRVASDTRKALLHIQRTMPLNRRKAL
jgi:hypothetical protein